jgi:hypothetical protein
MLLFLPHRGTTLCIGEWPRETDLLAASELRFLEPAKVQWRQRGSRLELCEDGQEEWREVSLARLFPHSQAAEWISVVGKDGKEIGMLRSLDEMSGEGRELVLSELTQRYVYATIKRIISRKRRFDMIQWLADTNLGQVTFLTRNLRDQSQRPFPEHLIIMDVESNRYDIPDLTALDAESRRMLEEEM